MTTYSQHLLSSIRFSHARVMSALPLLNLMSFEIGDVILQKDYSVDYWHHVIVGFVGATVPIVNGKRLPVHIYGQNEWFGEQSLLTKQASHFEYACLTPVELISMPKNCFNAALTGESNFVHLLAELVALRAQQHGGMLTLMHLGSSPLQVVMGLAQFAESDQRKIKGSSTDWLRRSLDVPISQNQIADYCGVSRTLFSEYIQHLSRAGWLKLRYGGIELQSVETWRLFARRQRQQQYVASRPTIGQLMDEMATAHAELGPYRFPNLIAGRRGNNVLSPMRKESDAIRCAA